MKYKKYNLIFIAALMLVVAGTFSAPAVFAAADDLMVEFENTPLFNEANFLPGSEVSRWAKVKNNTPDANPIIIEAINESDPDGLADVFEIGIYEGGIQRYGTTTLAAFFAAGEVSLSSLAGGGSQTQYDFLVKFVPGANNSYQGKSLGFDILVGFKGDEGGGSGGGGGGDGGGGAGGILSGLVIQNESAVIVTDTNATINWNTSFKSTSRVVYGAAPGVFNFGLSPNYGYSFSTLEFDTPANPNGVTLHSITLTGLAPSTTYYFRTISHASPDTISKEVSFITAENRSNGGSSLLPLSSNISAHSESEPLPQAPASGNGTGETQNRTINPVREELPFGEVSQNTGKNNASLLIAGLFGLNMNTWWLLLALIPPLIIYLIYNRHKSER